MGLVTSGPPGFLRHTPILVLIRNCRMNIPSALVAPLFGAILERNMRLRLYCRRRVPSLVPGDGFRVACVKISRKI